VTAFKTSNAIRSQFATGSKENNMNDEMPLQADRIGLMIRTIRGQRIILDADLARVYGIPTKRLNEQVRRNAKRFPPDFLFQLTAEEIGNLNRSQFATGSQKHRDPRLRPYAFTENGAIMAANVLNSPEAVRMSVFVVRAFVQMRNLLGSTKELAKQLAALEKKLTDRLDGHEAAIIEVLRRVMDILDPPPPPPEPPRRKIGFHVGMVEQKTKRGKNNER
jgi:ORF6N domain